MPARLSQRDWVDATKSRLRHIESTPPELSELSVETIERMMLDELCFPA